MESEDEDDFVIYGLDDDEDLMEERDRDPYFGQAITEEDKEWLRPVLRFLELDTADDDQLAEISQNIPRVYLLYKNALSRTNFNLLDKKRELKRVESDVRLKLLEVSSAMDDDRPKKKPTLQELDSRVLTNKNVIKVQNELASLQFLLDRLTSVVEALKMRSDALPALLGYRNKRTSVGEIR